MKRWMLGGAIAALVALLVVFGVVGAVEWPRLAAHRPGVAATSVAPPSPAAGDTTHAPATSTPPWAIASASASEVASATPTVKITAPIAVRARHPFTVTGTVKPVSAGETVTVTLDRKSGSAWIADKVATTTLSPTGAYTLTLTPPHGGDLKVVAAVELTDGHRAASASANVHGVGPKVIALTFDDGPWPSSTQAIVGILAKNDVHATFFELGSQVKSRSALSKQVVQGGNIIGVHTWNHALMTKRSAAVNKADLRTTKNTITKATGVAPTWFRPPYGATNKSIASVGRSLGLGQVLWSVDTLDWKYRNTPSIVSRAMKGARSGGIILMHDGGGPRKATVGAVPIIIKKLRAQGFDLVTLDEMAVLGYKVR